MTVINAITFFYQLTALIYIYTYIYTMFVLVCLGTSRRDSCGTHSVMVVGVSPFYCIKVQ